MDSWKAYSTRGDNYAAEKAAAVAQSAANPYMQGIQQVYDVGFGKAIQDSADSTGITNIKPQQLLQGAGNNFHQPGDAGNMPLANALTHTGMLETQTSATKTPQEDPDKFNTDALDRRLALMAKGGMNNLNSAYTIYPRRA